MLRFAQHDNPVDVSVVTRRESQNPAVRFPALRIEGRKGTSTALSAWA
jgi:hypothetical protein